MTTMAPPSEGPQRATIVGGGPCGSLLAMFLLEAGFETDVYELRDEEEVEKEGDQGGFGKAASATKRSINFALSHRGISALQKLSLDGDILAKSVEMHSRYLHLPDGSTATQKYGKPGEAIYSVSRPNVVGLLEAAARKRGAVYHHGHKLVGLDEALRPKFERPGGEGPPVTLESNGPLFGCDGAFSATRRFMERRGRFDTRVWYAKQGYKELSIPADAKGGYVYPPNYLHIWPRGDTMLIALPNTDGSFTSTLFANCDELEDMEQNWTREAVAKWFRDNFGDAVDLMPTVVDDFYGNPTAPLVQLQVAPWHLGSKVLCLGDASHAVVPFYGQGMNAAFEDCLVFSEILAENRNDVAKTFEDMSGASVEMTRTNAEGAHAAGVVRC